MNISRWKRWGVAAVCGALLAGCSATPSSQQQAGQSKPASAGAPARGEAAYPAPDFHLKTTTGGEVSLASLKGKVVLVDFWATWCGPCVKSIPHLVELYGKYQGRGLEILGVGDDPNDASKLGPYAQSHHIPYPIVYGTEGLGAQFGGVIGYPTIFVIDRNGQVVKRFFGYQDPRTLEVEIERLL